MSKWSVLSIDNQCTRQLPSRLVLPVWRDGSDALCGRSIRPYFGLLSMCAVSRWQRVRGFSTFCGHAVQRWELCARVGLFRLHPLSKRPFLWGDWFVCGHGRMSARQLRTECGILGLRRM